MSGSNGTGPAVKRFGDEIYASWGAELTVGFSHFMDTRWGLQSEVSVLAEAGGELAWGQVQLASTESRGKIAKQLTTDQAARFHRACREALALYRKPADWTALEPRTQGAVPWFWTDWVPANHTTVLYGDGDSGKSLLALSLAVAALTGLPLAGTWPIARVSSVLYVDYESTAEEHAHRLALLGRSLEITSLPGLHHLQASRPLAELGPMLRAQRARTGAGLLILDSLGAACAGEPESAQAAIAALNTLRQMGPTCTNLVLAHVSKLDAANNGHARKAYGSVYVRNLPRANVEVRRVEGVDGLSLTLRVDKNNMLNRKPSPVGLDLLVSDEGLGWRRASVAVGSGPLRAQILALLSSSADDALSTTAVATRLEADPETVRKALGRLADDVLVRRVSLGGTGRGATTSWIRIDGKRDSSGTGSVTPWGEDPAPP